MKEKRIHQRIVAWAKIHLLEVGGKPLFEGFVRNLSKGGVFVASGEENKALNLKNGQQIKFIFDLEDGRVQGLAEIAWMNPESKEVGLKFVKVEDGLDILMNYLSNMISPQ